MTQLFTDWSPNISLFEWGRDEEDTTVSWVQSSENFLYSLKKNNLTLLMHTCWKVILENRRHGSLASFPTLWQDNWESKGARPTRTHTSSLYCSLYTSSFQKSWLRLFSLGSFITCTGIWDKFTSFQVNFETVEYYSKYGMIQHGRFPWSL